MVLNGKGAAPGVAVGRVFVYNNSFSVPAENLVSAGEEKSHLDRYTIVKKLAYQELEKTRLCMQKCDPKKAEIFLAHQEILEDIVINEEIPAKILNEKWAGDWAIYQVYETVIAVLRKASDSLIAERAADFDDVRGLLLRLWYGKKDSGLSELTEPVIIAAHDLLPSDTANLDKDKVLAILCAAGGLNSHTAIIAKSYGIPAVMGITGLLETVKQGQLAVVNADEGIVIFNPQDDIVSEYEKKYLAFQRDKQEAQAFRDKQAFSSDGEKIEIGLNIAGAETELEACGYTDFVGLFRTEFLFMGRHNLPSEEEQFASYKKVLEKFGNKPVILRTIDIGGDKPISGVNIPREENPFLGNRALRFCFTYPEIFKTQLRAALRASAYGNLWLMLPMVSSIDDIRMAKEIIVSVAEDLKKQGENIVLPKIGVMIEIPSIALIADQVVKEVDFASIGTNDLCQYLCAADRMNNAVANYYQSYHPSVFKLINEVVKTFDKHEKPVSICGELASDPMAAPLLIGLGLRKLSMGAASVAAVKRAIASIDVKDARGIAAKALECAAAADVKKLIS